MNATLEKPKTTKYSAKYNSRPISFFFASSKAKSVNLVGDFNGWDPNAHPMQRREDGWWFLQVPLTHGHHQYYFLVDGVATLDEHAQGIARNDRDEPVSVIAVS